MTTATLTDTSSSANHQTSSRYWVTFLGLPISGKSEDLYFSLPDALAESRARVKDGQSQVEIIEEQITIRSRGHISPVDGHLIVPQS